MADLDSQELCRGRPLCAASAVFCGGCAVLTAEEPEAGRTALSIRGVGGGAEAGEGPVAAALREAREEIGADVEIVAPLGTLWWDADPATCEALADRAIPRALAVGRKRRASPEPYAPGLPSGPHLYLVTYLAVAPGALAPGLDQEAILLVPPTALVRFRPEGEWPLDALLAWGVAVQWKGTARPAAPRASGPAARRSPRSRSGAAL